MVAHLDDNALTAYAGGAMPPAEQSMVRAHLDDCAECRAMILGAVAAAPRSATPSRDDTSLAHARDHAAWAEGSAGRITPITRGHAVLIAGSQIGPYIVERLVGAGGMGVVYAARDPRLDRTVALKLIQRGLGVDQLVDRLRRESKALARLSHPNVTAVYELGSDPDIYVAMEFVAGTTLRAWLDDARAARTPRSPRDVLDTFAKAGRGLAAAHAAGLVHRDFKPDNVLLGDDGSVKVTDFGLATMPSESLEPRRRSARSLDVDDLTRTGAIVGTPAYMAPEQFDSATVDARADQFAFCVALYEALVGVRPFQGKTLEALADAITAGITDIPRAPGITPRIRRALLKGLAVTPAARFESMDALLAAIAPPRRTALFVAGAATIGAWGIVAATLLASDNASQQPALCETADDEAAMVWNPARRNKLASGFTATNDPDATAAWRDVDRRVSSYVSEWSAMHTASCKATHVQGTQSTAALDLRTTCLDRKRAQLDALLGVFEKADASVVDHAREAVLDLPTVAECANVEALTRRAPPPTDPEVRARYEALRGRIDEARALADVARYDEAAPALESLVGDPLLAQFPALEAEAHRTRGWLMVARGARAEAEPVLFQSIVKAQAGRADDMVAMASVDLAHVIGTDRQRASEALKWTDFAEAAIAGKGGDPIMGARLATVRGMVQFNAGKLADAEQTNRAALATALQHAPGSTLEAEVRDALGMALSLQGKLDEAIPMLEQSAEQTARLYGPQHSLTATVQMNLANAYSAAGRYDESHARYRSALAIREKLFGKDNVQIAILLSNMGQMLEEKGDLDAAEVALERALEIRLAKLGPKSPQVAKTRTNLGFVHLKRDQPRAALAELTRAGEILDQTIGPAHPSRADDLGGVGAAWLALGKPAQAIAPLQRAVTAGKAGDPVNLASMQGLLAQALYQSGRDRARGLTLASAARAVLLDADDAESVANIDKWYPKAQSSRK